MAFKTNSIKFVSNFNWWVQLQVQLRRIRLHRVSLPGFFSVGSLWQLRAELFPATGGERVHLGERARDVHRAGARGHRHGRRQGRGDEGWVQPGMLPENDQVLFNFVCLGQCIVWVYWCLFLFIYYLFSWPLSFYWFCTFETLYEVYNVLFIWIIADGPGRACNRCSPPVR